MTRFPGHLPPRTEARPVVGREERPDPWEPVVEDYLRGENDEERDPEDTALGAFVLACDTPGCLQVGEHFTGECYTVEMAEAWAEEMERNEQHEENHDTQPHRCGDGGT